MDGGVQHDTDEGEGDDHGGRTAGVEGGAGSDEKTSAYTCQTGGRYSGEEEGRGTDRAADGNHLEMAALEPPLQGRAGGGIGGALAVEDLAVSADGAALGDMGVGVALEGVPDAAGDALLGGFALSVAWGWGVEV